MLNAMMFARLWASTEVHPGTCFWKAAQITRLHSRFWQGNANHSCYTHTLHFSEHQCSSAAGSVRLKAYSQLQDFANHHVFSPLVNSGHALHIFTCCLSFSA